MISDQKRIQIQIIDIEAQDRTTETVSEPV